MKNIHKNIARLCIVLLVLSVTGAQAQVVYLMTTAKAIEVEQGTQRLLRAGEGGVTRVAIGNPAIADVNVVNRREVLLSGKTLGVTSLIVWMGEGSREYRVVVGATKNPLFAKSADPELESAVIEPGQSLEGRLPNLLAYRRAQSSAQQGSKDKIADRSVIEGESQVMTEVRIAEISRRTLQQYGLNLSKQGNNLASFTTPSSTPLVSGLPGAGFLPLQSAFNIVVGDVGRNIYGALSLLEQKGLARTLAEPSLVAMSGQTASYLAGGEFPVPVSQGGSTGGAVTIQYKEFGVRLNISPTILSSGRIAMKVAPEVSDLDFSSGIQVGGVAVPSLTVRRTDTTVELGDGESFVISGLVSSNLVNSVSKVPGLGDLPVLGAFFKSTSIRREDKELVMVVTPHLVRPLARDAKLPRLPGAKYDRYDPNFAQTLLFESGDFDIGFSR